MLRLDSNLPILARLRGGLRRWFRPRSTNADDQPIRVQRMASPQVRVLEPRFVLNATAELNVMGQLLVMGTEVPETVQLEVDSSGDLLLRRGDGSPIPIVNHPDGPSGATGPLDPSAVTSGQILFDMGGGNDVLDLELPSGLDVEVAASAGDDDTNLRFADSGMRKSNLVQIDSETITLDTSFPVVSIADDTLRLTGSVFSGRASGRSVLNIGTGSMQIDGRLVLSGDVLLSGSGQVDLSDAVLTANVSGADFAVQLEPQTGNDFLLGGADASGGHLVDDFAVVSSGRVALGAAPLSLAGDFVIRDVAQGTQIDSAVTADSLSVVTASDITVNDSVQTRGGEMLLASSEFLTVAADLSTAWDNNLAAINLRGQSVQLVDSQITTAGGWVNVLGPIEISGDIRIDTGNAQMSDSAGRVQLFDSIQVADATSGTLRIDALGMTLDGSVRIQGPVGSSSAAPDARDLQGLDVRAGQIEVDTIGVRGGDIELSAEVIQLLGGQLRTASNGQIVVDGDLLLPTGDTRIVSADGVRFTSLVMGQAGTRDLLVDAGTDAVLDGPLLDVRKLDVVAMQTVRLAEDVILSGDLVVEADTIRIAGNVDTTGGDPNGNIRLDGTSLISIENNAMLQAGLGSIQLDAGGGAIETGQATLRSDAAGNAIAMQDASSVVLGNIVIANGTVTLGIGQDIRDTIVQSPGTTLTIDRLMVSTEGSVDLTNGGNEIRSIERITSGGEIAISDALDDLNVAAVNSGGSNIMLASSGSMFLAERAITAVGAMVTLTAGRGIFDSDDTTEINIETARLTMVADDGIGKDEPLELLSVSELTAVTDSGGIQLDLTATGATTVRRLSANTGDILIRHQGSNGDRPIELESVVTGDGAIMIDAGGTITAQDVVSINAAASDDRDGMGGPDSRDVTLIARGMQSDILVRAVTARRGADVILIADDDILDTDSLDSQFVAADDLRLRSANQTADQDESIRVSTHVNDLEASVTGTSRGDLQIREQDSINLASSDRQDDEIVETANGQIVVSAGNKITIVDQSAGDDGPDRKSDPELVARGSHGRIDLVAAIAIELQEDVQLHSSKITQQYPTPETRPMPEALGLDRQDRSVYLESDSIVLAERIEIFTGTDQGTARIFSPRPLESDLPAADVIPAFYDPRSIQTNILEQALVNDATGILTVDVGREGERGLTIDIDWGAPTRRFQQINGLSADTAVFVGVDAVGQPLTPVESPAGRPVLTIEHFYAEVADIVDSRLGGREESTDDLEVRFAVRHHESILVLGTEVRQGPDFESFDIPGVGEVPKGEVSSTDNIATAREQLDGLESGRASFLIPPLSIPVAFFPVREVIPEIETRELVIQSETTLASTQTKFETVESVSSSIVGREEYFRIRVLSPDPEGKDLARQRLPDDILEGDKLRMLFEKLPDGRYEIEYVLSDANVRSILSVDVRGGQATIPAEELDEGVLRLRRLDQGDADDQKDFDQGLPQQDSGEPTPREPLPGDSASAPLGRMAPEIQRSSLSPASGGLMLASVLVRRNRPVGRKRWSAASRFAARKRSPRETSSQQER